MVESTTQPINWSVMGRRIAQTAMAILSVYQYSVHTILHSTHQGRWMHKMSTNSPSAGDDQTCTCTRCSSSDYSPVRLVLFLPLHHHHCCSIHYCSTPTLQPAPRLLSSLAPPTFPRIANANQVLFRQVLLPCSLPLAPQHSADTGMMCAACRQKDGLIERRAVD